MKYIEMVLYDKDNTATGKKNFLYPRNAMDWMLENKYDVFYENANHVPGPDGKHLSIKWVELNFEDSE